MVALEVTREEAEQAARAVLRFLAQRGEASIREIVTATGLTEALVRAGHAVLLEKAILRVEGKPARWSLLITPAELALRSSGALDRPVEF
jgi:DNA-binding IclR family transcriptional regulator